MFTFKPFHAEKWMDLSQARRFQSLAGRAGLIVGILLVAAMLDVVIARHRTDFNVMHVLPGQVEPIDGPLAEKTSVEELTYQSDSPDLKVAFDETHAGFWMGGQMWRGKLLVGSQIRPGKYTLSVKPKNPVVGPPSSRVSGHGLSRLLCLASEFQVVSDPLWWSVSLVGHSLQLRFAGSAGGGYLSHVRPRRRPHGPERQG